jgi:hypothetical protein
MTLAEVAAPVYVAGMALVFGGTAALSFAAAPTTFRGLAPFDAGRIFGKTLRVFDRMAAWAAHAAVVAAALSLADAFTPARLVLLVLAATVAASVALVRYGVGPRMAALKPPETAEEERVWDPEKRRAFDRLHGAYVRIYSTNLFLSLAALALAALA